MTEQKTKIARWRQTYLEHRKDPDEPRRCGAVGCYSRFPCGRRLEAAELLIVAGVGVPSREETADKPGESLQ